MVLKHFKNVLPNLPTVLVGVHFRHYTRVVVQDRRGLGMVLGQPAHEGLRGVVRALHERFARDVVLEARRVNFPRRVLFHRLGRRESGVVRAPAALVNPPPANARVQNFVRHFERHHFAHAFPFSLKHLVQHVGLLHGAREPVQNEAALAVWLVDAVFDDAHHHVVAHQLASLHQAGGLEAHRRLRGHGRPQHVTGGELGQVEQLLDARSLWCARTVKNVKQRACEIV